jgi:hypothetical protein
MASRRSDYGRASAPKQHTIRGDGTYARIVVAVFCPKGSDREIQGIRDRLVGKAVSVTHAARQGRCVGKRAEGYVARVQPSGPSAVKVVIDCYTPMSDCFEFDRGVDIEPLPQDMQ